MAFTRTEPRPLTERDLEHVPGVLGGIALERLADYADAVTPAEALVWEERPSFAEALRREELSIIAEVKRSSPSQGKIAALEPVAAAQAYARGGAAALSVLTEPRHFGGDLGHLAMVSRAVALPTLRKDFTVHPLQIFEALEAGASAVLLIVAVLGESTKAYLDLTRSLGLDALVEVHDERELAMALKSGADIVGVNNRDLRTLEIDLSNAPRLIQKAREEGFGGLLVAESGYREPDELAALRGLADAVLVGSSLAGSGDLGEAVRRIRAF